MRVSKEASCRASAQTASLCPPSRYNSPLCHLVWCSIRSVLLVMIALCVCACGMCVVLDKVSTACKPIHTYSTSPTVCEQR